MTTQREIRHPEQPLPACQQGHRARHIFDARCARAGGGHFIECQCSQTVRFPEFDTALRDWRRIHHLRAEPVGQDVVPFHPLRFGAPR